jgi:hypothetical protein
MGMACGHLIIQPPVVIHFMEGPFTGRFSEQGVVASRGVEAVAEYSVAGEGSVVGGSHAWGPRWNQWGLGIQSP